MYGLFGFTLVEMAFYSSSLLFVALSAGLEALFPMKHFFFSSLIFPFIPSDLSFALNFP